MKNGLSVFFQVSTCTQLLFIPALILITTKASARETPEPEIFLQPRNFNPHPYQNERQQDYRLQQETEQHQNYIEASTPSSLSNIFNPGPVQFPDNNSPNTVKKYPHPYARLELKSRNSKLHRFSGQDNELVTPAYQALANHARKVLSKAHQYENDVDYNDGSSTDAKKQYAFSYTVRDSASGDDFSHTQQQNNGAVEGSYNVQLPDGRTQIVKYIADNNGYRAEVSYQDEHGNIVSERGGAINPTAPPPQPHHQHAVQPSPLATAQPTPSYYKPIHQQYEEDYEHDESPAYQQQYYYSTQPSLYAASPSAASAVADGYNQLKVNNINIKTYSEPHDDGYQPDPPKVYLSTQSVTPTSSTSSQYQRHHQQQHNPHQGFRYTTIAPFHSNAPTKQYYDDRHYEYQLIGTTPAPYVTSPSTPHRVLLKPNQALFYKAK